MSCVFIIYDTRELVMVSVTTKSLISSEPVCLSQPPLGSTSRSWQLGAQLWLCQARPHSTDGLQVKPGHGHRLLIQDLAGTVDVEPVLINILRGERDCIGHRYLLICCSTVRNWYIRLNWFHEMFLFLLIFNISPVQRISSTFLLDFIRSKNCW